MAVATFGPRQPVHPPATSPQWPGHVAVATLRSAVATPVGLTVAMPCWPWRRVLVATLWVAVAMPAGVAMATLGHWRGHPRSATATPGMATATMATLTGRNLSSRLELAVLLEFAGPNYPGIDGPVFSGDRSRTWFDSRRHRQSRSTPPRIPQIPAATRAMTDLGEVTKTSAEAAATP